MEQTAQYFLVETLSAKGGGRQRDSRGGRTLAAGIKPHVLASSVTSAYSVKLPSILPSSSKRQFSEMPTSIARCLPYSGQFLCPTGARIALRLSCGIAKRHASGLSIGDRRVRDQPKSKKKKARTDYINQSLKNAMQFSLCDAMRYGSNQFHL